MIKFYTKLIQQLAKRYITKHQPIVVGVTGSAGKSSAVTAIGTVLTQLLPERKIYFPSKQLNGELGLPLTIFQVEYFWPTLKYIITTIWKVVKQYISPIKSYDIIVLEYGVDHVGEMDILVDIACPDFGVITNIDTVHFWDPEITRQEKSKLIKAVKQWGYLPLSEMLKVKSKKWDTTNIATFAIHDKQADIDLVSHEFLLDNPAQAGTAGDVLIGDSLIEIITNSVEVYYLMYVAIWYDIAQKLWAKSLKQLPVYLNLPAGRATLLAWKHNSIIFDSSYNSSPVGTYHILSIVEKMRAQLPEYGLISLMGEMRELYDLTEPAHRELTQKLIEMNIDYIWLVWESTEMYMYDDLVKACGDDRVLCSADSRKLGQRVAQTIANDDKKYIILVKWSQNTIYLEEAIKEFLANSDNVDQLCRQSDRWMIKKKQWFQSIYTS
jgi:UDP-N-acetylmuramoyl-tripeptide--D-alanyl-D-alanine ligase